MSEEVETTQTRHLINLNYSCWYENLMSTPAPHSLAKAESAVPNHWRKSLLISPKNLTQVCWVCQVQPSCMSQVTRVKNRVLLVTQKARERQRDGCFKPRVTASLKLAGQFRSRAQSKLLTVSKWSTKSLMQLLNEKWHLSGLPQWINFKCIIQYRPT